MRRITLGPIFKLLMGGGIIIIVLFHSYWPMGRISATSTPAAFQEGERRLLVLTGSAAPNSRGRLPVRLNSLGNENSLSFSLSFDPVVLSDPIVELENEYAEASLEVNTSQVGNGRLGIQLMLAEGESFQAGVRNVLRVSFAIAPRAGAGPKPIETGDMPVVRRIRDAAGNTLPAQYGAGTLVIVPGIEADVAPQPLGSQDGRVTQEDWQRIGSFAVSNGMPEIGAEFQRADCAPRAQKGDGRLTVADWVQAVRFSDRLDQPIAAGGPSAPANSELQLQGRASSSRTQAEAQRALRVKDAVFLRGTENKLEIELESDGNENAIGFTLSFDPTQLRYVRTIFGADAARARLKINTTRAGQGMIGIGLALRSKRSFTAGVRQVLNIFFSVPQTSSSNRTTVSLGDLLAVREIVDASATVLSTDFVSGVVRFTPEVNESATLTSLDPPVVFVSTTNLTLLVNGMGFVATSVARAGGAERETEFISSSQLRMTLLREDVASAGTIVITVANSSEGEGVSNPLPLFVARRATGESPTPSLFAISPTVVAEGNLPFTLRLIGNGFTRASVARIKGQGRMTRFVSETQLETTVVTSDVAIAGEVAVQVMNPPPGGLSEELKLIVKKRNPLPRITDLSLKKNSAGGFTLSVNGSNFAEDAEVQVNGSKRTATFVSASKFTVNLFSQEIATAGILIVAVVNPSPGGGKSLPVSLSIGDVGIPPNQPPLIATILPDVVAVGSQGFLLTAEGEGFVNGTVVLVDGRPRTTTFVSATQLTAMIPTSDVAKAADLAVQAVNPDSGDEKSLAAILEVKPKNPGPRIATVKLDAKSEESELPLLVVSGSNFVEESAGLVNGSPRSTEFVSSTMLRLTPSRQDLATKGTLDITVSNPPPGGGDSNTFGFVVDDPIIIIDPSPPIISEIMPNLVGVGTPSFTLVVNGSNFRSDSVIRINDTARTTKFFSPELLTTVIFPSETSVPAELHVKVFTPGPGGGTSDMVTLAVKVRNPVPQIASIDPEMVNSGRKNFQLTVKGANFVNGSSVRVNGMARLTSFISSHELSTTIFTNEILEPGRIDISVVTGPPGGGATGSIGLLVGDPVNPEPSISGITPNPVSEGSARFTLKVEGNGFMIGSVVLVNSLLRATTFVDSMQLKAEIPAADVASTRSLTVQVFNQEPGGGLSNPVMLEVKKRNPLPRIASLSPFVVDAGEAEFTLMVTGSNFAPDASVRVKGISRPTMFVSSTELSVQILPEDIESAGFLKITVFNPSPGGGNSNVLILKIR